MCSNIKMEVLCESCEKPFLIVANQDHINQVATLLCPFCGSSLSNESDEEDE